MNDLQARLQAVIGDAYRVERELGGGGMSRVFLAHEAALSRRVVIKVLPPEMAAGVNAERFRREIQLAASLQHPHIVPLLTAGSAGDLLWYVMPYIEGESLRVKLAREGELPVGDAVRVLRDVADALAHAHAHGVVHRDIKPDNILLSGKHALVADFGVARAMSASSGSSTVTSLGVALGTPAYMAPEQAAADPHIDHRADIYALGALAYEMLTGRTPFSAPTPQAMLAAHVTESVTPVTRYRTTVPQGLAEVVMRCLEKKPADRWQSADEVQAQLEAMSTPTGGITPTGTAPFPAAAGRHGHPARVVGWYGLASLAVLGLTTLLTRLVGVPDWVLPGVVALLVAGLPIMVVTGLVERRRASAGTAGALVPPRTGLHGWLTWRKALTGGGLAFGALGLGAGAYMAMRTLGIGPIGTLVASGVIKDQEALILANFENRASDTTLGPSLTEAFRVDLSQSRTVRLLDPSAISDALVRMERPTTVPLDLALARDIAQREGVKAIVRGQIDPVGRSYVLSASLISATDGHVLTSVRENATDDAALIDAIDKLSRKLRERIGESLVSIRGNGPLARVTTGSLEALRKYSQALVAIDLQSDEERGINLLREATALDTGFAMAWRKLAAMLSNTDASNDQIMAATTRAFAHHDRLPELEGYLVTADYYWIIDYDAAQIEAAYRSALELDPNDGIALNNLALLYNGLRRWPDAESLAVRATREVGNPQFANATVAQVSQGNLTAAAATIDRLARSGPSHRSFARWLALTLDATRFDYASALAKSRDTTGEQSAGPYWRVNTLVVSASLAAIGGRLGEAERYFLNAMAANEQRGVLREYLNGAVAIAWIELRFRSRPATALQTIEAALVRHPLSSLAAVDRPYADLAEVYAAAGRPEQARQLLAEYEANVPEGVRRGRADQYAVNGAIGMAEGRPQDAIPAYRARFEHDPGGCNSCYLFERANAFDRAGEPDSAIAVFERLLTTPTWRRQFQDPNTLAPTYKRLGELYEAKGDRAKAREYYGRFVDLWKDADPELQPVVRDVRARIARLAAER